MSTRQTGSQEDHSPGVSDKRCRHSAPLENLPDDVLTHVLDELGRSSLASLEGVCKSLSGKVQALGWPSYASRHPITHLTIHPPTLEWPSGPLVRYNHSIEQSILARRWYALQLGQTWAQPAIPVLKVQDDRVILGVGGKLLVHPLALPIRRDKRGRPCGGRVAGPAREYAVAKKDQGSGADIVGLVTLSGGQVGVGQYDGILQRVELPSAHPADELPSASAGSKGSIRSTAHYPHPTGSNIHTLTGTDDLIMSTTSAGLVSIYTTRSPWLSPATFELPPSVRTWSSLLTSPSSTLGFSAMVGTGQGISLYPLHPSGPSSVAGKLDTDSAVRHLCGPDAPAVSSAYSLTLPIHPSKTAGSITHHPSTLLSSWYDSHLRLHDLRSPSSSPIATFSDPYAWADGSAMYSATFLGENWIAGGGARHGTVCLFDVRWPTKGWSAFSPGGKGSPVYALQGDGGRLWGVSEKRAFVLAFDGSADPVWGEVLDDTLSEGRDVNTAESGVAGLHGEGLVHLQARTRPVKVEERVSGWKGRGGKWSWTVRYRQDAPQQQGNHANGGHAVAGREWDQGKLAPGSVQALNGNSASGPSTKGALTGGVPVDDTGKVVGEGVIGYNHADRSVELFDSVHVPYPPSASQQSQQPVQSRGQPRRRHR